MKSNVQNISIIIGLVVVVAIILYNLVPFLIYLFKRYVLPKRKYGILLDPNSLAGPWIRNTINMTVENSLLKDCSTVSELFFKAAVKFSNKQCFGYRQIESEEDEQQPDGKVFKKYVLSGYKWLTFGQIYRRVEHFSKGLLHIGVKPKDVVMIYAETRIEWVIAYQSLLRIGATVGTLYTTLGEEGIIHGINETEVNYLITNFELLNKLKPIINELPKVKCIVYINEHNNENIEEVFETKVREKIHFISLIQTEELGKIHNELKGCDPKEDDIAVLMYTSGSTGVPKAVMITHKNFLAAVRAFNTMSCHLNEEDVYMAYLPLAHVMEMSAELFFVCNGISLGFARTLTLTDKSTALKKGMSGDAPLLMPTIMACAPLILDRIRNAVTQEILKRSLFSRALISVLFNLKMFWYKRQINTPLINCLFCRKFSRILGGRIRLIPCGSAPLAAATHNFIRGFFNVHILQGYGLTESSATATLMDTSDRSVGFVGPPLEGIQIKLIDWEEGNYRITDKPYPRGEVVIGGNNISKGYYKNDKSTKESYIEEKGVKWFITGDIGEMYANGSLKLIDRKKDIIKLSTGEYISLAKIEGILKKNPLVANICVYGKLEKDYLIALIVPEPNHLQLLAKSVSKNEMTFEQLCKDCEVNKKALDSIKETTKSSALQRVEIPTKLKLCSEEWLPENGLVTAAFKLRRKNIQEFYQKDINLMYN